MNFYLLGMNLSAFYTFKDKNDYLPFFNSTLLNFHFFHVSIIFYMFFVVGYLKFASSFCRKLMEATLVDGNGMETRHIIVTTIGGKWSAQFKRV